MACRVSGRLARKPKLEKRVAVTVFSFPPDKGNVGTAAYLNVFGSIFRVLNVRACLAQPVWLAFLGARGSTLRTGTWGRSCFWVLDKLTHVLSAPPVLARPMRNA